MVTRAQANSWAHRCRQAADGLGPGLWGLGARNPSSLDPDPVEGVRGLRVCAERCEGWMGGEGEGPRLLPELPGGWAQTSGAVSRTSSDFRRLSLWPGSTWGLMGPVLCWPPPHLGLATCPPALRSRSLESARVLGAL